ncbi:hypothetical protein [Maritalea porphyrae]|uniref:Tryptophan synthase subunit beta n=1 Tax=Maritalea porphyrae TaxID=880732 RepID=A0ABQ5URL9_9HYPH|nr:hypothetical protein [Maritalea porphyrae]GLQ17514.1 hypothetical protein GCM10007879_17630 [Maritalea porphyrae]
MQAKIKNMTDKNESRLHRQYDRLEKVAPTPFARFLHWLRNPYARLVRIPLGILFVIGGTLSILPLLGIWMLPLGLLLLAIDLPLLRGPVANSIIRIRRWLENYRRKK